MLAISHERFPIFKGGFDSHMMLKEKSNNMEKCMRCGHDLILESNFMLSEINGQELSEDEDTMVTYAHCPHCGARYELTDTPEAEKPNYPYWG